MCHPITGLTGGAMASVISRRALLLGAGAGALWSAVAAALSPRGLLPAAAAAIGPEGTPYTGRGKGGLLIQSGVGAIGHYEAVLPGPACGVDSLTRDNDASPRRWSLPVWTAGSPTAVEGAAAIWSTYGSLELVTVVRGRVLAWWRDPQGFWRAGSAIPGITDAVGWPALIQSDFGATGNFLLVVPSAAGGLLATTRDNDATGRPWTAPQRFGTGTYRAVALIQSNFLTGGNGNLELMALKGTTLEPWWRAGTGPWTLSSPPVATNVDGAPAFVQSTAGTIGNFEVVAPVSGGGLAHWSRDNDAPGRPWGAATRFGGTQAYRAAGLVAGPLGPQQNNLEVAALRSAAPVADFFYRQGGWSAPAPFWSRVPDPATQGAVDGTADLVALGIHAALLPNGRVLYWGFYPSFAGHAMAQARLFDPATRIVTTLPDPPNIFCAGHAVLPDGRVLISGGHVLETFRAMHLFDATTNAFTRLPDMPRARWYPTITVLPDGRAVVMAGAFSTGVYPETDHNATYQIWSAGALSAVEKPTPIPFSATWPAGDTKIHWYPYVFVLPNGQLLVHSRNTTRYLTNVDAATWSATQHHTVTPVDRTYPHEGSAVLLPLRHDQGYAAQVLVSGGTSGNPAHNTRLPQSTPATATCEILQVGGTGWRLTAPMARARLLHDLVLLPDGTVLAIGGSAYGASDWGDHAVAEAELFDPATETWRTLAKISVPRGYHGTALLLPDGSVAVAGRDDTYQPPSLKYIETRVEIFKPPYFYTGARPTLAGGPATAGYGSTHPFTISVAGGASLRDVVLVRVGSVTHGLNTDQRLVTLARSGTGTVSVTMPPNGNVAPPGHYLIFAVDSAGRPSTGRFLRLT